MRLMLGLNKKPHLLVSVKDFKDLNSFSFWVINGAWEGQFLNGKVSILKAPLGAYTSLEKYDVLTTDEKRLAGPYNIVFDNFSNENFVSPHYYIKEDLLL